VSNIIGCFIVVSMSFYYFDWFGFWVLKTLASNYINNSKSLFELFSLRVTFFLLAYLLAVCWFDRKRVRRAVRCIVIAIRFVRLAHSKLQSNSCVM